MGKRQQIAEPAPGQVDLRTKTGKQLAHEIEFMLLSGEATEVEAISEPKEEFCIWLLNAMNIQLFGPVVSFVIL
jgi:hypothetical protein